MNLSTAGLAEDCTPGFSVPFGGCVRGTREADGVDLSEGAAAESVTFLSPASCTGMSAEGRGKGVALAPFYRDLLQHSSLGVPPVLTLETTFAEAHRCSHFLRLARYLKRL